MRKILVSVAVLLIAFIVRSQEAPPAMPTSPEVSPAVAAAPVASAQITAADVIFIESFSTEPSLADTDKKQERIEQIPESRLIQLQQAIQEELKRSGLFEEVHLAESGKALQLHEGQQAWVLGGQFLDYKRGNQAVRYFVGFGAGKQKVEVLCKVRDARTNATIQEKRIVDRKAGGWFGGTNSQGLKDFAERVAAFVRKAKATVPAKVSP